LTKTNLENKCSHPLIRVSWVDVDQTAGWSEHKRDQARNNLIYSYGLLVDKDEDYLYIADTHMSGDVWGGLSRFPLGCVHKVETMIKGVPCKPC
jgi:hypothetical protein